MARPTKLTPELQAKICGLLSRGHFRRAVAALVGVDDQTLSRWFLRGAGEKSGIYRDFFVAVTDAKAVADAFSPKPRKKHGPLSRRPRSGVLAHDLALAVLDTYERGARQRGYVWALSDEDALKWISLPCHYCGAPPGNGSYRAGGVFRYSGLDRLDNAHGYLPHNVVPCCAACNRAKHVESYEDFLNRVRRIFERRLAGGA